MNEGSTKADVKNWRDWIGLAARLIVGIVLLVAGGLKIVDIQGMQLAISAYQIFPLSIIKILSYIVPMAEIVLGLLLIVGLFTRLSAIGSAILFVGFIGIIASAAARGLTIDCGCFGGGGEVENTKYLQEIIRDSALLALSIWLIWRPRSLASVDQWLFAVNIPQDDELDQEIHE
ncbi:MAG: DoxX family protein [Actinomycetales bacterium]|nr:MAG: DoxX family protein [Actinomycetales bacterium]